ncbi:MAG TPA: hypothetical protein VM144_19210 [Aestuariivirga sp.]|nr:hypothetical protein [Aestuariivirga sp.]
MADSLNTPSTPKIQQPRSTKVRVNLEPRPFILESSIADVLGCSIVLTDFAEDTFSPKMEERDQGGYRVFRLTDSQVTGLFYLVYALLGHARELSEGFEAEHEAEVQS